jgi:Leucine-rich repeat (LRR) protein
MYLNFSSKNYEIKYRKYKEKYKVLKSQFDGAQGTLLNGGAKGTLLNGGDCNPLPNPEEEDLTTTQNLLDLCPEERITIQNKCYDVKSLYRWIITQNKNILPSTQTKITIREKQRLIQAYNATRYIKYPLPPAPPAPPAPPPMILTRDKLITLIPNLEHETRFELERKGIISINPDVFLNLRTLFDIRLSNNQISTIHPDTFINIPSLNYLSLDHNQISVIPPVDRVKSLFLNNNLISVLLPNIFERISLRVSLTYLNLSYNQISILPHGIFTQLHGLEKLYLNNNQIQEVQPGIFNKQPDIFGPLYLELLDLSDNEISVIQPNSFKPSVNLEKLYLSNNPIVDTFNTGSIQERKFYGISRQVIIYI